jgi:hypothetical protein
MPEGLRQRSAAVGQAMDIIYHIGAHCTDEERLVRCLLKNRAALADVGVAVPAPGRYRQVLRDTLIALKGARASEETQAMLLDAVIDQDRDRVSRLVFSHEFFLGIPAKAASGGTLYASAARRVTALARLFPDTPCAFHIAIRNPATLIPALIGRNNGPDYATLMADTDPLALRWAPVIAQMAEAVPESEIVVWCNEDSPMIWPEVLRHIAGVGAQFPLEGEDDILAAIMDPDGFRRMQQYLEAHPPKGVPQRRRMIAAFLARFALPGHMDVEIDLPGWTESVVGRITEAYDADLSAIVAMDRVEVILP